MKSAILIAPPSSGKGTLSKVLVERGYNHISTGDMLREEINKNSPLGKSIKDIMAQGKLVDDEIVFKLIESRLNKDEPFILDGFPRTINQAIVLDKLLNDLNIANYEVIYLDISLEDALKRALGRITCECGESYNIYFEEFKPQHEGICDKCGKTLIKRSDDNEESFRVRFNTFMENLKPIKEFYENLNKLNIIDTNIGNEKITEKVKDILK